MNTEDLLQQCLEDVAAARKTPAQCAAEQPQAPDLLGQLEAAQALRAWAAPSLSAGAARRHQAQLRAALAPQRPRTLGVPRWALAAMLVLALVAGGAGTVSAARNSRPGQALYAVKRAAEAVQTAFTPAARQAAWHASLAEERTGELLALSGPATQNEALVTELAAEVGQETEAALASVAQAPSDEQAALLRQLVAQIEQQQIALAQALGRVSHQAQAGLTAALTVARAQREAALDRLDEVTPPLGSTATPTATPSTTATLVPATATGVSASATATAVPPLATPSATSATPMDTRVPPGLARQTETAAALATAGVTATAPGNSGDQTPNCQANSPNSPQYCTPMPNAPAGEDPPPGGDPPPTPCPLNPGGNPVCSNRP